MKQPLRQHYAKLRQSLSLELKQAASQKIAARLRQHPLFLQSQHIACYYPHKNEVSTLSIIELIWQENKTCYLPKLHNDYLQFALYQPDSTLQPNKFKILEPDNPPIAQDILQLIITPLVAFDRQGHRLGMGAGYYDRTFANTHIPLMGIAYVLQEAEVLPADPWDIKLKWVITENEVIECG